MDEEALLIQIGPISHWVHEPMMRFYDLAQAQDLYRLEDARL
jgi:hypothetical protein